ncbi:unnamed protein product [Closterium sp. NIES-53]
MYALSVSAEGDYYPCVPPDPGIEAAALGAGESTLPGPARAEALHTCTLDSGASRCFFRNSTTLTPLLAPVPVRLGDPSEEPVLAHSSSVLLCPVLPSGSLSGLHLPSFSTNLHPTARVASCRMPRLRGMHSRLSFSSLPRSLPPLPPSPAPPCLPCVEGRQCAAPHSSSFPPKTAPLQTLHMDVWGPARVSGQGRERYFLLVVDDYTRYTTIFPMRSKGEVPDILIPWIRVVRLQLREWFWEDLPVLRLHSDRGGEFFSDLLRDFCRGEGILQSFTLSASPKQNGIAECRIGLVMEVAREVGDASVFRVWGSRAFFRDTSADKLSSRAIPCVFLGFPPDAPSWQFYHPTSRRVLPSQDVAFDESVPFYRLFPYRSAPLPPPPLFLARGPPSVDPLPPQGPTPLGVSKVDPLLVTVPVEVAVDSGVARGSASGGAKPARTESGGAEPAGAEPGGVETKGAEPGGDEVLSLGVLLLLEVMRVPRHDCLPGQSLSPRSSCASGLLSAHALGVELPELEALLLEALELEVMELLVLEVPGVLELLVLEVPVLCVLELLGLLVLGALELEEREVETLELEALELEALALASLELEELKLETLALEALELLTLELEVLALGVLRLAVLVLEALCSDARFSFRHHRRLCRQLTRSFARFLLQPDSPLPAPSPYAEQTGSFTERRELESRPASPVCSAHAGRRAPRLCPPPVVGTHVIALRPSSIPQRFPLPSPPASSLANSPDPESDLVRAASPTVPCLLTTVVTDPSFESTTAFAQVAELLDFAAACRLYYAASLIAESTSDYPPSVGGECALGTDVLEDRQEVFECLAATIPHLVAMLLTPEQDPDAPDIPTPRSYAEAITSTYVDAVPPPGANIVDAMWFLRVKRPPGSLPVFKARYVARGFSPRQGFDFFHTFSLPGFTGSFPAVSQWSLRWPVYGLRQAPRKLHDTLSMTLAAFGFAPSTADTLQFLRTDTLLPPFYILLYVDELVFATADTEALTLVKSELQKRHTCTDMGDLRNYLGLQITRDRARRTITLTQSHMVHQVLQRSGFRYSSPQSTPLSTSHFLSAPPLDESEAAKRVLRYLCSTSGMGLVLGGRDPVVLTEHAEASWVGNLATQRSSQGYTFSLGSGSVSWRSTCSSSVLSSSFEAEIYTGAMAAQELRRLTYLLADLGERPRSSPVLYVDNKAMIALCEEHRVEHRMKHIALRYFLHRELQQRSQLRLAYVATRANTADIFTKALQSRDRQRCAYFASLAHFVTLLVL